MDPNANLAEQRRLAESLAYCKLPHEPEPCWRCENASARLAELVLALDEWLSKGGAFPRAWTVPGLGR